MEASSGKALCSQMVLYELMHFLPRPSPQGGMSSLGLTRGSPRYMNAISTNRQARLRTWRLDVCGVGGRCILRKRLTGASQKSIERSFN